MSVVAAVGLAFACLVTVKVLGRVRGRSGTCRARGSRSRAILLVVGIVGAWSLTVTPTAMAQDNCEPPNPERPGSGMVGALDPAEGRGEAGSAYRDYGYAGMVWHVYEPDCGPLAGMTNPNSTIDTWTGNQLFNLGKNVVGATNALHYTVIEGGLFAPLNEAIETGADLVYNNIYTQLFGLVALLLAIMLFRHIWRGDLPAVSKRVLYALGAVWLAASSFALLRFHEDIDRAIVQTTTNIQAGFVDESEDRVALDVLPTMLHNEIVYDNWLRGEFGSPEAPQADEYGMRLLDAQAFTRTEIRNGDDADQETVDEKNAEYEEIAGQLGPATGYFTGEDGSRTGAGFLAFLQSLVYALFQLFAKAAVLLAQVLVRLLTLTAPLIGLVALLHNDILRKVARVAGVVAFNLVVLSVLAGVHALLLQAIFAAGPALSMMAQMAIAALVTILLFVVGKPTRRLWQMVDMSSRTVGDAVPAPSRGLLSRFRRRQEAPSQQDHFWRNARESDQAAEQEPNALGGTSGAGKRLRPEASTPLVASAQRTDVPGSSQAAQPRQATAHTGSDGGMLPATANPARLGYNPAGGMNGDPARGAAAERSPRTQANANGPRTRLGTSSSAPLGASHSEGVAGGSSAGAAGGHTDAVVVPSRVTGAQVAHGRGDADSGTRSDPPVVPAGMSAHSAREARPHTADREMFDGRPAHVVYRPSRGLEVQDHETDPVVR